MSPETDNQELVNKIVSQYWPIALESFPATLLDAFDRTITIRATLAKYDLKAVYIAGCNGRTSEILENLYGNHDNPYLPQVYARGWQDTDLYIRSIRQRAN